MIWPWKLLPLLYSCQPWANANHLSEVSSDALTMAPKEVAIIGAGAGGASAAYFLKQYASETGANVNVTIFERNPYIGGRSTTVNAWDDPTEPVELGASIFVEVNKNLVKAAKDFNLSTNVMSETPSSSNGPRLGVWNGKEFVLQVSANDDWWSKAKLLYRYGWAPIKTNRLMKEVVGNFLRMYDAPYFPWSSLSETLSELGLIKTTGITGEQYLKENGVGDLFANEIIQASTRVNYAQNLPLIHGVETMVCMATNGAMSVDGGNWQIFDRMARSAAKAIHLNTNVTALRKLSDGAFKVQWKAAGASADATASTKRFDSVVLAAPYQFSNIDLDPSTSKVPDSIPYVELHVTLFASPHLLSPAAFNLASDAVVPQVVLTTLQPNERPGTNPHYESKAGFFSISTLRVAQNPNTHPTRKEYIYKIFSHKPVPTNFIAKILGLSLYDANQEISDNDVSWILRKIWKSYPYEYPRVTFEELKLDENLWYTSGIESFISTMETSSLMGMNIAKLIVDQWSREIERADNSTVTFDFAGQQQQPLKAKL